MTSANLFARSLLRWAVSLALTMALGTPALTAAEADPSPSPSTPPVTLFNRIQPGWTNYSTAFNATEDTGRLGDFSTVASECLVSSNYLLTEYSVVVVGDGRSAPDFSKFQFHILLWTSLDAFRADPRRGNWAEWTFAAPTGGSTAVPDSTTRGGRPAYLLRFSLTNSPTLLTNNVSAWIGFAARGDTSSSDSLFVPTSSFAGPSDVQAGDLVDGGWRYLVDAGGSTVYSGQLAVSLTGIPVITLPGLHIESTPSAVLLWWASSPEADDIHLEESNDLRNPAGWSPINIEPVDDGTRRTILWPRATESHWFRLAKGSIP